MSLGVSSGSKLFVHGPLVVIVKIRVKFGLRLDLGGWKTGVSARNRKSFLDQVAIRRDSSGDNRAFVQ